MRSLPEASRMIFELEMGEGSVVFLSLLARLEKNGDHDLLCMRSVLEIPLRELAVCAQTPGLPVRLCEAEISYALSVCVR